MSEFRGYLERLKVRPDPDRLTPAEKDYVLAHFDAFAGEVIIDGVAIRWDTIDEVEVVKAARASGAAGWLVKQMIGEDRYHFGVYYGSQEAVLPNITLNLAAYFVQMVAFHAPNPVRYKGIEGLSPIANA